MTEPLPLKKVIRPTTIIEAPRLSKQLGVNLTLASETFQHTGSFKFRAAYNLAAKVPQRHLIAASSGNFGQALAYACALLGKSCTVVMPDNSAQVKVDAVREYGGNVDLINRHSKAEKNAFENWPLHRQTLTRRMPMTTSLSSRATRVWEKISVRFDGISITS